MNKPFSFMGRIITIFKSNTHLLLVAVLLLVTVVLVQWTMDYDVAAVLSVIKSLVSFA